MEDTERLVCPGALRALLSYIMYRKRGCTWSFPCHSELSIWSLLWCRLDPRAGNFLGAAKKGMGGGAGAVVLKHTKFCWLTKAMSQGKSLNTNVIFTAGTALHREGVNV